MAVFLNEVTFIFLARGNASRQFIGIQSLLENESSVGNSYLISRSLGNLEKLGFIKCVKLTELRPSQRDFYDTRYQKDCSKEGAYQAVEIEGEIKGAGGTSWLLSFRILETSFFYLSRWLGRLFSLILVFCGTGLIYFIVQRERQRRDKEIYKTQKIKDLAFQVAHDVASPLSALNLVSGYPNLNPEIRDLLKISSKRTSEIIGSLKSQIKNFEDGTIESQEKICLNDLIKKVIREKSISSNSLHFAADNPDLFIFGNTTEMGRLLSNLLNNAIESRRNSVDLMISIQISDLGNYIETRISDNGVGMSATHLSSIGQKEFTFGKKNGSGYGIFHAKEYLKTINGIMDFQSELGIGTSVTVSIPKYGSSSF